MNNELKIYTLLIINIIIFYAAYGLGPNKGAQCNVWIPSYVVLLLLTLKVSAANPCLEALSALL